MRPKTFKNLKKLQSLQRNSKDFFQENVRERKTLENNEQYLKLSKMLFNEEETTFYFGRQKILPNHEDFDLLLELESHINTSASLEKINLFENFMRENQYFPDFDTLAKQIKENQLLDDNNENQFFLKYNDFDLENLFRNNLVPFDVRPAIKKVIIKLFNFLAKKMDLDQVNKIVLAIAVTNNRQQKEDLTLYFPNFGAIAMIFTNEWWDTELNGSTYWSTANEYGAAIVHEFAHALDILSFHQKNNWFLVNCHNIEQIYALTTKRPWRYSVPINAESLKAINDELTTSNYVIEYQMGSTFSAQFADFIFDKATSLMDVSENKKQFYTQNLNLYGVIICALIPSNYARREIIVSNFQTQTGLQNGIFELFAEAFAYLLSSNNQNKNIFWEWTYDFFMQDIFKK